MSPTAMVELPESLVVRTTAPGPVKVARVTLVPRAGPLPSLRAPFPRRPGRAAPARRRRR